MSLIERIREALKPLAPLGQYYDTRTYGPLRPNSTPELSYSQWNERLEQMEQLTKEQFTPDHYGRFAQIFTTSVPTDENKKAIVREGKIIRYSDTLPDNIGKLLSRLSYDLNDKSDVQVGKYIALLIGFREINSMLKTIPREFEVGERQSQILGTIKEKLQDFPFYASQHIYNAVRGGLAYGRGYGSEGFVPPMREILFPHRKIAVSSNSPTASIAPKGGVNQLPFKLEYIRIMKAKEPHEVLGVKPGTPLEEVIDACNKLALLFLTRKGMDDILKKKAHEAFDKVLRAFQFYKTTLKVS